MEGWKKKRKHWFVSQQCAKSIFNENRPRLPHTNVAHFQSPTQTGLWESKQKTSTGDNGNIGMKHVEIVRSVSYDTFCCFWEEDDFYNKSVVQLYMSHYTDPMTNSNVTKTT
jgi:hypothetical protein